MKRCVGLFTATLALSIPAAPPALAAPAQGPAATTRPAAGVFPPGWCEAGRLFFAPVFQLGMPIITAGKDFFGPGEEFMCGERKTVPAANGSLLP